MSSALKGEQSCGTVKVGACSHRDERSAALHALEQMDAETLKRIMNDVRAPNITTAANPFAL